MVWAIALCALGQILSDIWGDCGKDKPGLEKSGGFTAQCSGVTALESSAERDGLRLLLESALCILYSSILS